MKRDLLKPAIAFLLIFLYLSALAGDGNLKLPPRQATAFTENKGQIIDQNNKPNPSVLYLLNTPGMNVQLRRGGFSYDLYSVTESQSHKVTESPNSFSPSHQFTSSPSDSIVHCQLSIINYHRIDFDLLNSNPACQVIASEPSADYLNYYTTGTPVEGVTGVRKFSSVTYKDIYPNVDLEFVTDGGSGYKYNFLVHPGGDVGSIRLKIEGPDKILLSGDTLKFSTSLGDVNEVIPESYLLTGGSRTTVKAHFREIGKGVYGFIVDEKVPGNSTLVIDPTCTRVWGTFYGGAFEDPGTRVLVDENHNAIITGYTQSLTNIASAGAFQTTRSNYYDGFIAKFTAGGVRLWGTYYGYTGPDYIRGADTDLNGNIYVGGYTSSSTGMGTPGAFQETLAVVGASDGFLAKFSSDGMRTWGTYYGGVGVDDLFDVASDIDGNVYITGMTYGDPNNIMGTLGSYQPIYLSSGDGFLAKFDTDGARLWGTYYGHQCYFTSCSVDNYGTIYVAGSTNSSDLIASTGAYQTTFGGGLSDAFLVAFTPSGQRLWGTYYGGALEDGFMGGYTDVNCKTDNIGSVYITGHTKSLSGIASAGAYQTVLAGTQDGFMARFSSLGVRDWGTYYGGSNVDRVNSTSPGSNGEVFFTGETNSADGIATTGSYMETNAGGVDAFLVKFNATGQRLWGTFFGGPGNDYSYSSRYVTEDTIYFMGTTNSMVNIATLNGHQTTFGGYTDAFLEKFIECWPIDAAGPITSVDTVCTTTFGVSFSIAPLPHAVNYFWTFPPGFSPGTGYGPNAITLTFGPAALSGNMTVAGINKCGDLGPASSKFITVLPRPVPVVTGPDNTCTGPGKVYSTAPGKSDYIWSTSPGGYITLGGGTGDNTATVYWTTAGLQHVYLNYTENGCAAATPTVYDVQVTDGPAVIVTISESANNVCAGTPVTFTAFPTNGGTIPVYQWKVNAINVINANNAVYTYTPLNGDQVTCVLTSDALCSSNNPATSNIITMSVYPPLPVTISIAPSANPVCAGSPVTFTATPGNEGLTPAYQWKLNGGNVGLGLSTYTYVPTPGDLVSCILTSSNTTCVTNNPATSNTVTMGVDPNMQVGVTIAAVPNPYCTGDLVAITATPDHGGLTPTYLWKVNDIAMTATGPVYTYTPVNGDQVRCYLTSSLQCTNNNPAMSNNIVLNENSNFPASVNVTTSANPFCPGTSVTYTAWPTNGGILPSFQWRVNGINTGSNQPTYTYSPMPGDSIRCIMTSNLSCVTGSPASSAKVIMSALPVPAVTFTTCFDTITTINAKPIKLKGGLPYGGTYSGPGVNSATGIFTPSAAGVGTHTITYSYTNALMCSASNQLSIINYPLSIFNCGSPLTDIRDNKVYPTVQIGTQCWMQSNLDFGSTINDLINQTDNCIVEKYTPNSPLLTPNSFYQWDEVMRYDPTPGLQGLCPPGWHVPDETEWNTLFNFYQGNARAGYPLQDQFLNGFKAQQNGVYYLNAMWSFTDFATLFWSSTMADQTRAYAHGMNTIDQSVSVYAGVKSNGFSVRCLKD